MKPHYFHNSVVCQFPIRIPQAQLTDWMPLGELEIESHALVSSSVHVHDGG